MWCRSTQLPGEGCLLGQKDWGGPKEKAAQPTQYSADVQRKGKTGQGQALLPSLTFLSKMLVPAVDAQPPAIWPLLAPCLAAVGPLAQEGIGIKEKQVSSQREQGDGAEGEGTRLRTVQEARLATVCGRPSRW